MARREALDLSPQFAAAVEALAALAHNGSRACVIGGLAVQRWGEPRFTSDADLTVLAPFGSEEAIVDGLMHHFGARRADARQFALDRRVLLLRASNGVHLDVSLAALPFEAEVLERASTWRRVSDVPLVTCTAEDLVVYKLISARPGDIQDVIGIVRRRQHRLDVQRIRHWARQFAELKEDPDLLRPFEDALRKTGLTR
jgi:hypothetical protein